MIRMASVAQALEAIAANAKALPAETVPLAKAYRRRLAAPVIAQVSQPPADVSAMDGYAVAFTDMKMGAALKVIAESRAGEPYPGSIKSGEAVRIFTGAYIPRGADHVLIQEDAKRDGDTVIVTFEQKRPENIRRAGLDFAKGAVLVPAGHLVTEGAISLAAAGNVATLSVHRQPRVAILANGDELLAPGSQLGPGQIVNSIQPALIELVRRWGAAPIDLGVSRDDEADVRKRLAQDCDVIVSIGGASVGDYDVVRSAFAAEKFEPIFEKIAVKPGKPTWFSKQGSRLVLGLPGNPAAAMVTAQLFLKPLIDALSGAPASPRPTQRARTMASLPAASNREEYLRAILTIDEDGTANVTAAENQDSSLLSPFLTANALIRRPPNAPAAATHELVEIMDLA